MADYLIEPTIPLLKDAELRRFVLGVADRQVFTSAHMSMDEFEHIGMVVFIPLIGGFNPEVGVDVPTEPKLPPSPPEPTLTLPPPKPSKETKDIKKPGLKEPDSKHVEELAFRIRWGRVPEGAIDSYHAEIAIENEESIAEHGHAVTNWEAENTEALEKWDAACLAVWKANKVVKAKHKEAQDTYNLEHDVFIQAHKEWEELCDRWCAEFCQQVGVIYEWMDKALPRSVDGYPTFGSFTLLHRDDWERAKKAIVREQERRETIEV